MNDNLSGWNDWSDAFEAWTDVSISELHGLMTALMTVCHAPSETKDWEVLLTELSFVLPDERAMTLLTEEAEDVAFALKDKDDAYQYTPLVPDDEHELYERFVALKNWANGFLTGVGVADINLTKIEEESLVDLAKIGAIRVSPDEEFEGGEETYLHLYEFARLIPVSLATRKRKSLLSIPLIAGLPLHAKTANEITDGSASRSQLPPVIDAMNHNLPS